MSPNWLERAPKPVIDLALCTFVRGLLHIKEVAYCKGGHK